MLGLNSQRHVRFLLAATCLVAASWFVPNVSIAQETLSERLARQNQGSEKSPMLVDANELIYDDKNNVVTAIGDVQIHQQGRTLEADRVRYDRNTERVFAEGRVKLTETQGNVTHAEVMELGRDFKDGFIQSVLLLTPDKTRFAAQRGERTDGEYTVFDQGVYTACEPCKKDPTKAPLWQMKAKKIVHRESERTIYYEDAQLEVLGQPIAWVPYFSTPDPTVKRKTGFLTPTYVLNSELGFGVQTPFFWAIAPNYDLTLRPTLYSKQGLFMDAEWRHQLLYGSYSIRAAGISQLTPSAFPASPLGAGSRDFRGLLQTKGDFYLNDRWSWGWNINLLSDKFFLTDYDVVKRDVTDLASTLYLTGQGDRSYFDMRGYYFMGLTSSDRQKYLPFVAPVVDYSKTFDQSVLGGEVSVKANLVAMNRQETEFVGFNAALPPTFATTRGFCTVYNTASCLVMGPAGSYTRASTELSWRASFTDQIGQVWTPFASVKADAVFADLKTSGALNGFLPNFMDTSANGYGRVMPSVGLTYRYPFVAHSFGATHIFEPIAQIVASPNEQKAGRLPNEDAQNAVFDDSSLFSLNRFGGWDRSEGGTRGMAGAQYSLTMPSGFYASALIGQSFHLAGRNSFQSPDATHAGLDSGLDKSVSDYVTRLYVQPTSSIAFSARSRHDDDTAALKAMEVATLGSYGRLSSSLAYARVAAQPQQALSQRAGVFNYNTYRFDDNWSLSTGIRYNVEKKQVDYTQLVLGYQDECLLTSLDYNVDFTNSSNKKAVHKFLLRLELRTLGDAGVSTSFKQNPQN